MNLKPRVSVMAFGKYTFDQKYQRFPISDIFVECCHQGDGLAPVSKGRSSLVILKSLEDMRVKVTKTSHMENISFFV